MSIIELKENSHINMKIFLINCIQTFRDAAITHTTAAVVSTMIGSCSVVLDPLIYIINHQKYRQEILNLFRRKTSEENSSKSEGFTSTSRVASVHGNASNAVQLNP